MVKGEEMNYTKGEWEQRGLKIYRKDTNYEIIEIPCWSWQNKEEAKAEEK